jgi:hypothetical protein
MKRLEQTLTTYVYRHRNICNIWIYFRNIQMKHLQRTSKTSETLKTYVCNMSFRCNITLLLARIEARRRVEFSGVELTGDA